MNYESIYPFMCTCVLVTNAVINEIYQKITKYTNSYETTKVVICFVIGFYVVVLDVF